MKKEVIFTDLDGTLLDHDTYSYAKAKSALNIVKKKKIPLIICTSKTRAETEVYRKKLGIKDPFIVEDGGAIFIPNKKTIELGTSYKKLRAELKKLKKRFLIVGFGDMTPAQLKKDAGLTLKQARLAEKRDYDEPFIIVRPKDKKIILNKIKKAGFNYTKGGRYYHLMGKNDKGKAVRILSGILRKKYGKIKTIGIGDSQNDFKMLSKVDKPYLVMKKNKKYASNKYNRAGAVGPAGWNKVIKKEIK
ncbi:HAD-IIB family hydrolase [Nanoarchaeota archaeon]